MNTVTLTATDGAAMIFAKEQVRVVEALKSGSLVTLCEGEQHYVLEDSAAVLELLKSTGEKR